MKSLVLLCAVTAFSAEAVSPPVVMMDQSYNRSATVEVCKMLTQVLELNRKRDEDRTVVVAGNDYDLLLEFWKRGWFAVGLSMVRDDSSLHVIGRSHHRGFPFGKQITDIVIYLPALPLEPLAILDTVVDIGRTIRMGGFFIAEVLFIAHADKILRSCNFVVLPFLIRFKDGWYSIYQKTGPAPFKLRTAA